MSPSRTTTLGATTAGTTPVKAKRIRTKNANGGGGIYPRTLANGKTVYDARCTYRDTTGRARRGVKRGLPTRAEAARFLRQVTAAVDARTYTAPSKVTLGEYLARYLEHSRLKPQTLAGYEQKVRLHIAPHLGHIPLKKVTPTHLNALYRRLETHGSPGGTGALSLTSVRHVHNIISGAYTAAVREGLLASNPAVRATPPTLKQAKEERSEITVWTAEQVQAFLEGCRGDHYWPLWRLLAASGMRRGDALALQWRDVDLEAGFVSLRRSLGEDRRGGRRTLVVGTPTSSPWMRRR